MNIVINDTQNVHLMSIFQLGINDNKIFQSANMFEIQTMLLVISEMQDKYEVWSIFRDLCHLIRHHVSNQGYQGPDNRLYP